MINQLINYSSRGSHETTRTFTRVGHRALWGRYNIIIIIIIIVVTFYNEIETNNI